MNMRRPSAPWRMIGPAPAGGAMRRVAIAFFAAGGLSALARTYAPDPDPSDHGALLFLALVCLVGTLALVAWRRPPEALLRCLPEVGVLLVSAGVAVST